MKNYETSITMKDGSIKKLTVTEQQAKQKKNIQNFVFTLYNQNDIKKIDVKMYNDYTKNYYNETTYDQQLETLKSRFNRVELTYKFDSETEEKTRCYIGKSTGWIPIYLEIKRKDSTGGSGLLTNCINALRVIY
jgi:hypothetical protein